MELYYSTPYRLKKKLDLISQTSPSKSKMEIKTIVNSLDNIVPELETQFRYLRDASSPEKRLNNTTIMNNNISLNHSYLSYVPPVNRTMINHMNTSIHSTASMNHNINNRIYSSNYAQRSYYLESKLENKNKLIKEYEYLCSRAIEKLKEVTEENLRLKVQLGTYQAYSPNRSIKPERDSNDVKYIKRQVDKISKEQCECNRKLNDLYISTTSKMSENYNSNSQWDEMRKMNEEINMLMNENKNNELKSEAQLNELRNQIATLERELGLKSNDFKNSTYSKSRSYIYDSSL